MSTQNAPHNTEYFEAYPALKDAVQPFELQASTEKRHFTVALHPAKGVWLAMYRDGLIAAVGNIISNAFKYGGKGMVSVNATVLDDMLHITVDDEGAGLPDSEIPRMFEWLARGQNETPGFGVGLASARETAERYGGTLHASRRPEKGMRFSLILPLSTAPESHEITTADSAPLDLTILENTTIFLIEDNHDLREQISELFSKSCIIAMDSGIDAAQRIIEEQPAAVIVDVMLPTGPSGLDILKELKASSEAAHIPVILMSALDTSRLEALGYAAMADSCLGKPFRPQELQRRIVALVTNRQRALARARQTMLIDRSSGADAATPQEDEALAFLVHIKSQFADVDELSLLTITEFAKRLHTSTRSLQRDLKSHGVSFQELKRLEQVRRSMHLMRHHDISITEVAQQSGFNNSSYFSRVFKEITGLSPKEWRAQLHAQT